MDKRSSEHDGGDTTSRERGATRRHHCARWVLVSILSLLAVVALGVAYFPIGKREVPPTGFSPIRDDAIAARYQPLFDCPAQYGPIRALYYRAAKDESGLLHIAYHPLWAKEENLAPGFGALLSRYLYTGGLSLQHLMFGPGDIEVIGLTIDPASGAIVQVDYETAANYDASKFSVTHETVSQKGSFAPPLRFSVMSWNHLFALEEGGGAGAQSGQDAKGDAAGSLTPSATVSLPSVPRAPVAQPPLSYFTSELWSHYGIWKNPQTILRKDRAHFIWERAVAE